MFGAFGFLFVAALVKRGVDRVKVLAVELFLSDAESIAKALIVYDLTLAQVAQRITHIGVVAQANEVVVGRTRLLFCYCRVYARKRNNNTPLLLFSKSLPCVKGGGTR